MSALVTDVVHLYDLMTQPLEQASDRVSERRVPQVPHMEGFVRVGLRILNHDFVRLCRARREKGALKDARDRSGGHRQPGHEKVQVRPRYFNFVDPCFGQNGVVQALADQARHLLRWLLKLLGEAKARQRDVAVLRIRRLGQRALHLVGGLFLEAVPVQHGADHFGDCAAGDRNHLRNVRARQHCGGTDRDAAVPRLGPRSP
mmetsp:Transcript_16254/g.48345  ORF Transcript_16254/g.48345 Transcript_16254/m.48345 type:complete len:202 (+) Transcript_16254:1916-2521(+)